MSILVEDFDRAIKGLRTLDAGTFVMFVLRHAESLGQKKQQVYKTMGDGNIPLTPHGVRQAKAAGVVLSYILEQSRLGHAQLISSTGHRSTRTTVEIFNQLESDTYINFDARLDKQKFGDFDGLFTSEERMAACPDTFPVFQKSKEERGLFYARPPNGESIEDVQMRMRPFFTERVTQPLPTVIVTHGTNALCLEDIALDRGVQWIVDRLDTRPNCAIRMITRDRAGAFAASTICTDAVQMYEALCQRAPRAGFKPTL
jgi:2,3-bisphosphoglycerate-dependent phosphoglycerate mutase